MSHHQLLERCPMCGRDVPIAAIKCSWFLGRPVSCRACVDPAYAAYIDDAHRTLLAR